MKIGCLLLMSWLTEVYVDGSSMTKWSPTEAKRYGRPHLRLIMNLIPANAILHQLHGKVQELPGITQYQALVLEDGETLRLYQNDVTSAFYLFSLPEEWMAMLSFNLVVDGKLINKTEGTSYCLSCQVLPVGWSSAVSVMQEVSEMLLVDQGFPKEGQVMRSRALPSWMTAETKRFWWHVSLDNFFAGERLGKGDDGGEAEELQHQAETVWATAGVLSAEKKKVKGAEEVPELGGELDGVGALLGGSAQRLTRIAQTTLFLLSQPFISIKWLQVICGRWVLVLQFRRAGMAGLQLVWKWIGGKKATTAERLRARQELLFLLMGCCLFHTHLGAKVSNAVSASDASGTGGAVGAAYTLREEGQDFCQSLSRDPSLITRVPILVISLFNGVGGCFRAYDVLAVEPMGLVSFDASKAANRVTSRRWPQALMYQDVRSFDEKLCFELMLKFPHIEQIVVWAGFPCVDLSKVKAFRKNLRGEQSGLFIEIVRILNLLKQVFGRRFPIFRIIDENVSSMDREACEEISATFGEQPYRVQCSDAVPISRPRYCWADMKMPTLPGIKMTKKEYYTEIEAKAPYPEVSQWLREGSLWGGEPTGDVFPTCVKAIPRQQPPPLPAAGLSRCNEATRMRWEADQYRYPPYQYKDPYVIWSGNKWRLLDPSERDILHGYGYEHTAVCWSASDIKKDPVGYHDQRASLMGDSFSVFSFVIFAWRSCFKWLPSLRYTRLANRMGLAPGTTSEIKQVALLARKLCYGYPNVTRWQPSDLTRALLARVNHTGSDVRISTGTIMNPKAFPRQSASASWWDWKPVFKCRWQTTERINTLEMRSILLALRWRVQHLGEVDMRLLHLTDSYISMSILSNGRSSSQVLSHVLRKISAFCFAFGIFPVYIHVESTENPADEDSRA